MKAAIVREFPNSTIGMVHQTGQSLGERHQGLTVSLQPPEDASHANGCAEVYGGDYYAEIGLTFEGNKLVDYDGVFELPSEVVTMLKELHFDVSEMEPERCRGQACNARLDDGEGYDGLCGNCADKASRKGARL